MARQGKLLLAFAVALAIILMAYLAGRGARPSGSYAGGVLSAEDAALRYPYQQLTKSEQELYTALRDGIAAQQTTIPLPRKISNQAYEKVYLLVGMQEPQFFYLDTVYELSEMMTEATMHYTKNASEIAQMQSELDAAAERILRQLSPTQSDAQRLLTIHDQIAKVCKYDTAGTAAHTSDAYGCLVEGRAQCEGYAKAFLYVARRAAQSAMCVTGRSAEGGLHVWNIAKFDKEYAQIDVTWDDSGSFQGTVSHVYFAMPDALFTDHIADGEPYQPPACTSEQATIYRAMGWQIQDASMVRTQLATWVGTQANAESGLVEFQCSDTALLHSVRDALQTEDVLAELLQRYYGAGRHCVCLVDETRRIVSILLPRGI